MNRASAHKALLHKLVDGNRTTIIDEESGTFSVPHFEYNIKTIQAWIDHDMVVLVGVWHSDELFIDVSTLRLTETGKTIIGWEAL